MPKGFYMTEPNQPDFWMEVQKSMPGFFGALMTMILVQRPRNKLEVVSGLIAGTAMAYFVGPFATHWMGWEDSPGGKSAMGFLLGSIALALVPGLIRRAQHLIGLWNGAWPPQFPDDPTKDDADKS